VTRPGGGLKEEIDMPFHRGEKVEIFRKSADEGWGEHMDQ
jgi:hypothetical protein